MIFSHFSFQVFAWIASVSYALALIVGKLISKHAVKNPWLFNFLYACVVLLLTLPFALTHHAQVPSHWGNIITAGLITAIAASFYVLAMYRLDASSLGPLFNIRAAFVVLVGFIFLGERLNYIQLLLMAAMVGGGILVTLDERLTWKSFFSKGSLLAMCDMLLLAFMALFINRSIATAGFWTATLWILIWAQIFLLATLPLFLKDLGQMMRQHWLMFLALGIFDVCGTLASNKAYSQNLGISAAIISIPLSSIIAFAFSLFAPELLEKHTGKIYLLRFIGAVIMVWAGIRLA